MDSSLVAELSNLLSEIKDQKVFMEVCGTHTMEIGKMGLRDFLGDKVRLISGPGCPVCVTPSKYIDYIYSLAVNKDISIISYGDMLRVPGSRPEISLLQARALGADVKIVYSAIDAIEIASANKNKEYLFLAIGFETTMPSTCILLSEIISKNIDNLRILSLHKKVEPVMKKLIRSDDINIDGFLCPGNVAVIIGEKGFEFLKEENELGVIAGFSEDEILMALITLLKNSQNHKGLLINKYTNFVKKEGNKIAIELVSKYFIEETSLWRGIGAIEKSGFELRDKYKKYDIKIQYPLEEVVNLIEKNSNKYICRCGDILKGKINPKECESFGKICTPTFPLGPCMVSSEGTCGAYYKYEGR